MTNISKRKLKKDVFESMSNQFVKYISILKTPDKTGKFLSELLTKEERIMLSKRFMAIVMLERGYNATTIEKLLKLSYTTIFKLNRKRESGDFDSILNQISKNELYNNPKKDNLYKGKKELGILETLLRAGLPPIVGPGRWSSGPYKSAVTKNMK